MMDVVFNVRFLIFHGLASSMVCSSSIVPHRYPDTNEPSFLDHDTASEKDGPLHGRSKSMEGHVVRGNMIESSARSFGNTTNCEKAKSECCLHLDDRNINKFRHNVFYEDLSFVKLHLNMKRPLFLKPSRDIVGEGHWVWTFFGQHGGLEFLRWPSEFQIWSLGLLNAFVGFPLNMNISRSSGNCSGLVIGQKETDFMISEALLGLEKALHELKPKGEYDASFFCYRKRKFLYPTYLYLICKHIVCPFSAIKYSCCRYFYVVSKGERELQCAHEFSYDQIWWLAPIFAAILLFSFCPLILLSVAGALSKSSKESTLDAESRDFVFLDRTDHVTLLNTLPNPAAVAVRKFPVCLSRFVRFLLPFLSYTLIGIQIYLDHVFSPNYAKECVNKGVPMGFRSMASGFKQSARNFLPFLGGPFIASALYLAITSFLVTTPKSMHHTLTSGLLVSFDTSRNADILSPLKLTFPILEYYGSTAIRKRHGYQKIYAVYVAQLNLLININFWKFVFNLQCRRWQDIYQARTLKNCFLPLYAILCIFEVSLILLVYGFPVVSFGITIFGAYRNLLLRTLPNRIWKPFVVFASVALVGCVVFFIFMFCTIFLDACLFVARLCIFTYTGILLYPRVSYGYLIFVATVFYYLWDSIQNYSRYYFQLLRTIVSVCESFQRANNVEPLVKKSGGFKGIQRSLFEDVIEKYSPRRQKVIISFVKVFTLLSVVGLSIHLLLKTNRFQDLHVIMHVGTTLLICALPKVIRSICSSKNSKIQQQKTRAEIRSIIKTSLGFISDSSEESD